METPTTPFIAPHLREPIFRAYEPLIRTAVNAFPSESSFTIPSGVAPTTFVANFRNAILSLKRYKWETYVDCRKLWSISSAYVINQDTEGVVWFRLRQPRGRPNLLTSEARTHAASALPSPSLVPWADATQEEISALCLLIHTKRLAGPYEIRGEVGTSQISDLINQYDVGIVYHSDSKTTVIT